MTTPESRPFYRLCLVSLGPLSIALWLLLKVLLPANLATVSPPLVIERDIALPIDEQSAVNTQLTPSSPALDVVNEAPSLQEQDIPLPQADQKEDSQSKALAILRRHTTLFLDDAPCPDLTSTANTDYFDLPHNKLHITVSADHRLPPFSVMLHAKVPGRIYLVRAMAPQFCFVADVQDLRNGSYLCHFPSLVLNVTVPIPVHAHLLHACTNTLYTFWCSYNYSAPRYDKCPVEGRDPRTADVGRKVATFALIVQPSAELPPKVLPPCGAGHRERLPGLWLRRMDVNIPQWAMVKGIWIGDTLTIRADYVPSECRLRPINYQKCVQHRFFVFLGDSTLRNIFYCFARGALNVNDTGAVRQSAQLEALAPKWEPIHTSGKKASDWRQKEGNMVARGIKNPVYIAWASHLEQPPPELPEFFASFEKWRKQLGHQRLKITVLWTMGAHSPGVNISNWYDEVLRYAKQFKTWMDQTGNEVYHISMKAVRKLVKGQTMASFLLPAYTNPRIFAKNIISAELLRPYGIPTIDLFYPTLSYWTNWEFVQDGIHYKDWVDTVLRDIIFQSICPDP